MGVPEGKVRQAIAWAIEEIEYALEHEGPTGSLTAHRLRTALDALYDIILDEAASREELFENAVYP